MYSILCRASCFAPIAKEKKDEFYLFFRIDRGKTAGAARNWKKSAPKTDATTFPFVTESICSFQFVLVNFSMLIYFHICKFNWPLQRNNIGLILISKVYFSLATFSTCLLPCCSKSKANSNHKKKIVEYKFCHFFFLTVFLILKTWNLYIFWCRNPTHDCAFFHSSRGTGEPFFPLNLLVQYV